VDEVLRNADLAMYAAKLDGKGKYRIFDSQMHLAAVDRLALEQDLRVALETGQLIVHYQPVVRLNKGQIIGVEALVRWQHPERGLLEPDDFISIAEETGLIRPLGRWVLHEACRQMAVWQSLRPANDKLTLSVNLSMYQLVDEGLVTYVAQVLEETKLAPDCLVLEIMESTLARNTNVAMQQLHTLKALGVQIAIDDFGTGYSSLSYLRQFPIDVLKIDKSFVNDLSNGNGEAEIVSAMLRLGHSLHIEVLAEGIEQPEQAEQLNELQCELGQGYYFSRPGSAQEIERLLIDDKPARENAKLLTRDPSLGLS
jgi:EAL domain-containing protein (putative c-di-GMP-specific phosphodiesterase class I)